MHKKINLLRIHTTILQLLQRIKYCLLRRISNRRCLESGNHPALIVCYDGICKRSADIYA
ncbi:hypothetical protein D3C75_261080 [compost metagenome]